MNPARRITPFLWFNDDAEAAVAFYLGVFPGSRIVTVARYGEAGPGPRGTVMTIAFQLDGQDFVALNGGPSFRFTPAVSFVVNCATQAEIDHYWEKLSAGGQAQQCGWLTDRFGVSWQVVPADLGRMVADPDPARAQRVMQAVLGMGKLDIAALRRAYEASAP